MWVLVVSNLMAMLIQYLSAKAGIATGNNLGELCRRSTRAGSRGLWVQAELVAIATDLAEVLGGAVALQLLFGLPLLIGGVITAVVAFGLLGAAAPRGAALRGGRHRDDAGGAGGLPLQPAAGRRRPAGGVAGLVPRFEGADSVLLAPGCSARR